MSQLGWIASVCVCAFTMMSANAAVPKKKDLSARELRLLKLSQKQANRDHVKVAPPEEPMRPFSELEEAGYLFFSSDYDFDSRKAKQAMAANLPADVQLVIFASPGENRKAILRDFEGYIALERVRVVEVPSASRGFWARDGLPIATWGRAGSMDLVDAKYYHRFEPDQVFAGWFQSQLYKHDFYFEGGNFMVGDAGECITVNNDLSSDIPDSVFTSYYGCKKLIRLPFRKGIGHVDESVRFLKPGVVVTDDEIYARTLQAEGLTVLRVPRPENEYETYVNALLINGTIYVPVFEQATDEEALNVYRSQGLNVVPVETIELSNQGLGSLHCITMTYPKVPFQQVLKLIGGREL